MNTYYHGIELSFNYWYLFVIAALIAAVWMGTHTWDCLPGRKLVRKIPDIVVKVFAAGAAGTFVVLMVAESWNGFVQFFDNHLDDGMSPAWSLPFAAIAIVMVAAAFGLLLWGLADYFGKRDYNLYKQEIRRVKVLAERDRRAAERFVATKVAARSSKSSSLSAIKPVDWWNR